MGGGGEETCEEEVERGEVWGVGGERRGVGRK